MRFDGGREQDRMRFQVTYEGFVTGGLILSQKQERHAFDEKTRLEAKVSRKLKAISEEGTSKLASGKPHRGLLEGPQVLELEQVELDALLARLKSVPWSPDYAEDAVDAVDFLAAADKVDEVSA
ncbi:MAG: hypothetical protein ABR498_03590 [Candidatus Dormibacteria bacterium]